METWRNVDPVRWLGVCPTCGADPKQYRKLEGDQWVNYNLCDCGQLFNFRVESINPLFEALERIEHVRELAKSFNLSRS